MTSTFDPRRFALAGNAIFTVENPATMRRFTFQVRRAPESDTHKSRPWFVGVLSGPDNTADYMYIGLITESGVFVPKRNANGESPSIVAFRWVWPRLERAAELGVNVYRCGRCGRCGRLLTTPESVTTGIGPICIEKGI